MCILRCLKHRAEHDCGQDFLLIVVENKKPDHQAFLLDNFPTPCFFIAGIFSLKTKYDESDNVVIRATRLVTDKLSDVFSE